MSRPVEHRVLLPRGSQPRVAVGDEVAPDHVLAAHRSPGTPILVPIAGPLRSRPEVAAALLVAPPGTVVEEGSDLARRADGRAVKAPSDGLLLSYDARDGTALFAPLGAPREVVGHVRGTVDRITPTAVVLAVPGAAVRGVGATGEVVHGELLVAVHEPGDELRAAAIDIAAAGRIVVGGSRASAEALIRARAMGVAGIVLGGVMDKELRDFEAIQHRRRALGGMTGAFALLLVEGFGKVGLDPQLFAWFRRNAGRMASLVAPRRALYVYDASPPPARRSLARAGDRIIAHRRPFAGKGGVLLRVLDGVHATPAGVTAKTGLVRFDDGRTAALPLANLEATLPAGAGEEA